MGQLPSRLQPHLAAHQRTSVPTFVTNVGRVVDVFHDHLLAAEFPRLAVSPDVALQLAFERRILKPAGNQWDMGQFDSTRRAPPRNWFR
jgi:hypothetical protein